MRLPTIVAVWSFAWCATASSAVRREVEEIWGLGDEPKLLKRPTKTIKVFIEAPPPDITSNSFVAEDIEEILDLHQGKPHHNGGGSGPRAGGGLPKNGLGGQPNHNGGLGNLGGIGNIGKLGNNPLASFLPSPLQSLIPTRTAGEAFGLLPSQLSSFLANPFPNLASLIPKPLDNLIPTHQASGMPPPKGGPHPTPHPGNNPIKPPIIGNPLNKQHPPGQAPSFPFGKEPKQPKPGRPGHEAQCTQQEISCNFVREAAYQMQNDDDECLKLATSFDADGKIHFEPIAQDNENVIYGLTTDGLTASAWCNDIGWALRKIYLNCRRGNKCFGGSAYAARNSVFLVTVGPRVDTANIPDPRQASKSSKSAS